MGRKNNLSGREGFTLIEAISTVAILAVIMIALFTVLKPQVQILKAKDGQRKSDLNLIANSLEDWLNDNPCYPEESVFSDCGGSSFSPYLRKIPCDPVTKQPYPYEKPECQQYLISVLLSTGERYVVTSPNYPGTSLPTSPPGGVLYGCFSGVCRQITEGECDQPNYQEENCYDQCGSPAEPTNECKKL